MHPEGAVYIIDDDDAVRESLRWLFDSVKRATVAFASAEAFLAALDAGLEAVPGCAVVDVRMSGLSGLDLQERLNQRRSTIPIILVTGHGDVPMAVRAMKAGAFGFLTKPCQDQELLDLVHGAIARQAQHREQTDYQKCARDHAAQLTPREAEVMHLVVEGFANRQIATTLNVAEKTVETHRANIMRKMKAQSLPHLVRMSLAAAA